MSVLATLEEKTWLDVEKITAGLLLTIVEEVST